ncbi:TPA: hypothetical protein TXL52_000218 [Streptococcus suis]|nr:hypothetical protein [Streptococcus suis]
MQKKWKFLVIGFFFIIGVTGLGLHWFGQEQTRLLNEQLKPLNLQINTDTGTKVDAIGGSQNPRIIGFFQKDQTTAISQRITAVSEEVTKTASPDGLTQKEWIVLYPQTRTSPFTNAAAYSLMKTTITADWLQVRTSQEEELEVFYEKKDESLLTLQDLIADKETFREQLEQVLVSSPAKTEGAQKVHEELLKTFAVEDWSDISFAYEQESLVLPKAIISMSVFVESLNETYFSEQTLAAFRAQVQAATSSATTIYYP